MTTKNTDKSTHSRQTMPIKSMHAKVLAVTSGKGGVGKTNIAANLAICLAAAGKKVLLVDADLSLGNVDLIMNINSRYNISHMINGQKELEDIIHTSPEGVDVICGASGLEGLADLTDFQRKRVLNAFSKLSIETDFMIIDTAAGICKTVVGFCLAADQVLVVTTPESTAITDAYAMIKVLVKNNFDGHICLLVNMAESVEEGRKTYKKIANVVMRFLDRQLFYAGVFIKDERVSLAIKQRTPVVTAYPRARITSSITALAAKLSKASYVKYKDEGFFRKVVNWFS